jgi:membrane protein DedA with SNARE-associated domain
VLSGDVMLYWIGRRWGQRVLDWRVVRWVLAAERQQSLTERYREHAIKTVAMARHVAGLRAVAFLATGIARVPFWKFLVADAAAAAVTVPFAFALAYLFTNRVTAILADVHRVAHWAALIALIALPGGVIVYMTRWNRRVSETRERL